MSGKIILLGPITLFEFRCEELNKHIYMFGDIHEIDLPKRPSDPQNTYTTIIEFIQNIIDINKSNNKKTDLFLEIPFVTSDVRLNYKEEDIIQQYEWNSLIVKVYSELFSKKNSHLKFHEMDIRKLLKNKNSEIELEYITNENTKIINILHSIHERYIEFKNPTRKIVKPRRKSTSKVEKHSQEILHNIFIDMCIQTFKELLDNFDIWYNSTPIDNELKKLEKTYHDLNILLKNKKDTIITNYKKNIIDIIQGLESLKVYQTENDILKIVKNIESLVQRIYQDTFVGLMDIYTLSRLLKDKKYENIIIFAGDVHIFNYYKFLKDILGCRIDFENINYDKFESYPMLELQRHIDITEFKR